MIAERARARRPAPASDEADDDGDDRPARDAAARSAPARPRTRPRPRRRARRVSSRIAHVERAQPVDRDAHDAGSGFGEGWVCGQARRARRRPRPRRGSARSAPGRPSARPAGARPGGPSRAGRGARSRAASVSVRRSRAPDSVSRSRSSWARASSPVLQRPRWPRRPAPSATLSRPGFLSPLVVSSWRAALELLLGPAGAPVGAADARLEPVAQGGLVAGQVAQLVVADRRGAAEERLGRDAGQLGQDLVGEGRVGDGLAVVLRGRPCPSRRRRTSRACRSTRRPSSSSCSNSMRDPRPGVGGRRPTAGAPRGRRRVLVTRRVMASSMARWIVVLPASLGPRTTVTPGASSMSSSR